MVYDNAKLVVAFEKWLEARCVVGYGSTYVGELMVDFMAFSKRKKLLKGSPGHNAFGECLMNAGFHRKRVAALTHWMGVTLKKPPKKVPRRRYKKTLEIQKQEAKRRIAAEKRHRKEFLMSPADRRKRRDKIKREMKTETAERNRAVGVED